MSDAATPLTLVWKPVSGADSFHVSFGSGCDGWEPPLPRPFRRLDRALRRLEWTVTRWERAFQPAYTYTVTAVNAMGEAVPVP